MALRLLTSGFMQGPIRCALIAVVALGCDAGHTTTPDADAAMGRSGLTLEWSSAPASWPNTKDGVTIESARFSLDRLRVIGDAGPGDPRTTSTMLDIRWDKDLAPGAITYDDAPPGLYSQVALAFDGHSSYDSFEIRGRVLVDSDERDFRIEDSDPLAFNVAIDEMLSPGESATIRLRVNFTHALESIDWTMLDSSDGRLELDSSDTQMATFRTNLIESFEIVGISSSAR